MKWKSFAYSAAVWSMGIMMAAAQAQQYQQPQYSQNGQYRQPQYQQPQYGQGGQYQQPQDNRAQGGQFSDALKGWSQIGAPGVFSAYMPGSPSGSDTSMGDTSAMHWASDMGEPMHMFAVEMQSCGQVSGNAMDDMLYALMSTRAKTAGAPPAHKRRIDSQVSPGCMFDVVTGDTEWNYMIRVVGTNVVTLSVCSMPGQGGDQYVQQFFRSFSAR